MYVYGKSKMVANTHGSPQMTTEKVLDKIFADRDSEFSEEESEDG